jgi:ABC-type uncharacterized transport system involved in gliding motility auxiliary subunit
MMAGSFAIGILALAVFIFLNREAITLFSRKRSSRHGANMLVMILLFACIVIIIQALSSRHNARIDLTRNQRFSLSGQTTNLLDRLNKDIEIHAFFKRGSPDRQWAESFIKQYAHKSERVRPQFVDPDQNPQLAQDMGVTNYGMTVVKCGPRKELLTELNEGSLTNAILKVYRDTVKGVYIVKGHGEKNPRNKELNGYSFMSEAVEADNYSVYTISLLEVDSIPSDCYLLIIAGPENDYLPSEIDIIEEYLSRGRNAIIMIDPQTELPNVEALLARYNVALDNNIIIDHYSRRSGGDYRVPLVSEYENHPITRNFNESIFFPLARSVRIIEELQLGDVEARYLIKTGKFAWGESDMEGIRLGSAALGEEDVAAPVPIAVIATRKMAIADTSGTGGTSKTSTIIVFGDSDFANNSSLKILGNDDFLLNTVNFLAEEEDMISIRPKQALGDRVYLSPSQERFIFLVSVVVLPLIVIVFGTSIYMRRRKSG